MRYKRKAHVRRDLWFGDSAVMVADEFPEMGVLSPQSVGGTSVTLNLFTEDVDALWERAVGAEVLHPLQDAFWGDRHGQVTDPFGHRRGLAQHVRDLPRGGRPRRGGGVQWLEDTPASRRPPETQARLRRPLE